MGFRHLVFQKEGEPIVVVPMSMSLGALVFQIWWAVFNGCTLRYLILVGPIIPLMALGAEFAQHFHGFIYIPMAYILFSMFIYFPYKARTWQAEALLRDGFELVHIANTNSKKSARVEYDENSVNT